MSPSRKVSICSLAYMKSSEPCISLSAGSVVLWAICKSGSFFFLLTLHRLEAVPSLSGTICMVPLLVSAVS